MDCATLLTVDGGELEEAAMAGWRCLLAAINALGWTLEIISSHSRAIVDVGQDVAREKSHARGYKNRLELATDQGALCSSSSLVSFFSFRIFILSRRRILADY